MGKRVCRDWSTREVSELLKMRDQGVEVQVIAERMGRSRSSVSQQLFRQGKVVQPKNPPPDLLERIRAMTGDGAMDDAIAHEVGLKPRTVRHYRKVHLGGLRGNRPKAIKSEKPRCFNCDKVSPVGLSPGWKERVGWTSHEAVSNGCKMTIAFCRKCSDEGDMCLFYDEGTKRERADAVRDDEGTGPRIHTPHRVLGYR